MRRTSIGVVAGVLMVMLLAGGSGLRAQTQPPPSELTFLGGGTKAGAMGGAFVGLADDVSAGYWNPAGLVQNDRVTSGLQFRYQQQRVRNQLDANEPLAVLFNSLSDQSAFNFNFAAFNSPITIKGQRFYLSASWFRAQDENFQASYALNDLTDFVIDPSGQTVLDRLGSFGLTEGGMKVVSLAAGTPLKEEKLSAGFGINIYIGRAYDSSRSTIDFQQYDPASSQFVSQRLNGDTTNRRDFRGVNFGFGALYEMGRYSFGVSVKTPFTLKTINDYRAASRVYERTPDTLLLKSESSELYLTDTKVDIPVELAVGLVFRPQENLLFAVDYEYKGFGNSKTYAQTDLLDPKSDFVSSDPQWDNIHQFRFGVEYQVGTSWGNIPLRAGFRTEPLPYRHLVNVQEPMFDITGVQPTFEYGDQIFGEVYTFGTGIQWSQVRLDLTYEYHTATSYQDGYFVDDLLKPNFISLQNNRNQRLSLGFTGFF